MATENDLVTAKTLSQALDLTVEQSGATPGKTRFLLSGKEIITGIDSMM